MIYADSGLQFLDACADEMDQYDDIWRNPIDTAYCLANEPPPLPWLFKDRVQMGRATIITGIGGSGKTPFLYNLAVGAATGRVNWDWEVEKKGRSIILAAEDERDDVHRRLNRICLDLSLTEEEICQVGSLVEPHSFKRCRLPFLEASASGRGLQETRMYQSLVDYAKGCGDVVLIAIDPAQQFSDGDEMLQSHQRRLGALVDDLASATGAAVCLVTHAAKANESAEISSHHSRGGGALTDAVRAEYVMRSMNAKESENMGIETYQSRNYKKLALTKGNNLPPEAYEPIWLQAGPEGALDAAPFDSIIKGTSKDALGKNQKEGLNTLLAMKNEARSKDGSEPSQQGISLTDWREKMKEGGMARNRVGDTVKSLQEKGLIKIQGELVFVTDDITRSRETDLFTPA